MSKRDQLGRGTSFGSAGSRSARRGAIDQTIHAAAGDTAAITDLPVTAISENPDNPRNHLRALDEAVETVRELGVILPIVVATVEAYLHDRPDRAGDLDAGAQYVVVDGHRRLEASRRVGLATIPVRVDNARVATDEALLEAAFVANYHRDDMTDLEEAHALQQLVEYYGSQTKASKRLGIAQGTISSKLSLLKLTPELQKDLMTGARTVEHVRNLGKLSPKEQVAKANGRAAVTRRKAEVPPTHPAPAPVRQSGAPDYHGVIIPEAAETVPPDAPTPTPGEQQAGSITEPREAAAPEGTADQAETIVGIRFPYEDGKAAAGFLIERMPSNEFATMMQLLTEHHLKTADAAR
ncbi:ParB/RepB/Spo0J family partition protein [Streptomyces sp. NPDC048324]|uniref:ParB/RepB/Spo0J family partition protein n=1 Tax=Streptomyces sp. NPDC048324 TaxID=3157205 RepID=UPI00344A5C0F